MKLTSRRYVAAASVAALATLGATFLALAPANAASATSPRLEVSTTSVRAAAGTCSVVLVQPEDTFGAASGATETVTILLSENPSDPNQDLDFCVTSPTDGTYRADTPSQGPFYTNGADFAINGGTQMYTAGPGITNTSNSNGGNPDNAGNAQQTAPNSDPQNGGSFANTNPSGVDRARYTYNGTAKQPIRVGVVGLTSGSGTIKAFIDEAKSGRSLNFAPDADETQAPTVSLSISPGGTPGSVEAAQAVTNIDVQPADDAAPAGQAQPFTATLLNSSGDGVRGVRPLVQVASNGSNPGASATCGDSDNNGVAKCTFTGTTPGTDTLTVFVNRANGSAGPDLGETKTVITRTTTKTAVAPAEARYLDLTPKTQTITAGRSDTFTATITDVNGAPAQNVSVTFTESGPGVFFNGSSSFTGFTDNTGRLRVRVDTNAGETGAQTITAAISTISTQCSQPAGSGTGSTASTPAGRCSDTATNNVVAASASPSPSTSATPTATVSASPSSSPTPSRTPSRQQLALRTSTPDIQPNQSGILDATGEPNSSVELRCYTRPNTSYFTARGPVNITTSGTVQFRILPGANTRCYVRYASDDATASPSVVINVHTTLSLSTVRTATRTYIFQGRNLPRRAGQLITLYRVDGFGNEIRTSNLTTDSSGIYRVTRTFTGTGTFRFKVRTSQTLNNAAGVSNTISVRVF